jgi:TolB-like protein
MSEPSLPEQSAHKPDASTSPTVAVGPWARIKEHKVLQWSLAYLGAALALAHGQELLAHTFHWPELIGRILVGILIVGFPIAIALAWYHGHRGMTRISAGEMTVVSLLVAIAAVLLIALVRVPPEPGPAAPASPRGPSSVGAGESTQPRPAHRASKARIAILPFVNLSPDPANEFFTDGLHEEILATLSGRARGVEVISRTTIMTYRTPKPVQQIAHELGATHVLEGSVRREGDTVRLTLQLINARTDEHLWSREYDRTLKSALTLESEVANEVASQLVGQLASSASSFKPMTQDPQAYDLFLRARLEADLFRGINTPLEALQKIEQLLDDALSRDPDFARAYAQRARTRLLEFVYGYDTPQHAGPLARKDLDAAERLAPDDPEVVFVEATYLDYIDRDPARAVAALEAAGADGLYPRYLALSAQIFSSAGRIEDAIRRAQQALALDPKNTLVYSQLMLALFHARQPVEALRIAHLASAEFPLFRKWRTYIIWAHTGTGPPILTPLADPVAEITANVDAYSVEAFLFPLRIEHRYREMVDYIGHAETKTIRGHQTSGRYPVAALRGWTHLLLGDQAAAARDGREVLDFVAHSEETQWNRVVLTILTAQGHTFRGERTLAIAAAGKALQLSQSLFERQMVPPLAASVYAWSGAADDAASLLEKLSVQTPMTLELPPATIARDPLYTVPLAGSARYQALRAKLEAQMAATKLE